MTRDEALVAYVERPELARLWAAARSKVEALGRIGGEVRLSRASEDERRAVADLLGLPRLPGQKLAVGLGRLDRALASSRFQVGLREVLELLGGPVRDLPAERGAFAERRETVWSNAFEHPLIERRPVFRTWLEDLRRQGLPARLGSSPAAEADLIASAFQVLEALPVLDERASREVLPLGVLARTTLGSSHALDPGRPVATLVLRALAQLADRPPPGNAAERRELWETAGVVLDELSSHVLVLGLSPVDSHPVAESLRQLSQAGEPARITLRQLRSGCTFAEGLRVRIVENPVVLAAAADRLGARCPPLVSVEGVPNLAARRLLAALEQTGARLLYHGDFDWPGLRIARTVAETIRFEPWRFSAADYRRAAQTLLCRNSDVSLLPLREGRVETPWDPGLSREMAQTGLAIEEEEVLDELLGDL